jgi:hypothetical protein
VRSSQASAKIARIRESDAKAFEGFSDEHIVGLLRAMAARDTKLKNVCTPGILPSR